LAGCALTEHELKSLSSSALVSSGSFVTSEIECKMDKTLQSKAHGLLLTSRYSHDTWKNLSIEGKKQCLSDLIGELNSAFGTEASKDIEYFQEQSGREARMTVLKIVSESMSSFCKKNQVIKSCKR
jgi:hypothetical protein